MIVTPFPDVIQKELRDIADEARWEEYVDEICLELEPAARLSVAQGPGSRTPRPHQVAALAAWAQRDRRGILEHATGSGKTFTALCTIRESLERGEVPLVLVPSELLLNQWREELTQAFESDGLRLLVCGGGHRMWEEQRRLPLWTRERQVGRTPSGARDYCRRLALRSLGGSFAMGLISSSWRTRSTAPEAQRTASS